MRIREIPWDYWLAMVVPLASVFGWTVYLIKVMS